MKCYIYCTKAKPYLNRYASKRFFTWNLDLSSEKEPNLNGKIVASFDLNKIEEISRYHAHTNTYLYETKSITFDKLAYKSRLCQYDIECYLKDRKGYAWHIDNLEILDKPLVIMGKAPQSWQYCRDIVNGTNECCILISIKPEWVCKILNGEKTIEVRKTAPKEFMKGK